MCRNKVILNFANNSGSKQNKKIQHTVLYTLVCSECVRSFSKKILYYRVVFKVFKFSGKIPGFSKTIELYLNFCMGFYITQLALSNSNKISP